MKYKVHYKLECLQQDLRNGMGLNEALIKNDLTFKQAVTLMPRPQPQKSKKKRGRK